MSSYTISSTLNKNKVFILQKSEIEKRFDPFYYIPDLLELEKKVLAKKPKKLRDYVQGIASGATPKITESEKYYSENENGVPFLRVQNLSPTGVLEFDDCKYINQETHNGMLKRSQVMAGDLLVKITGVGRMAVASIAPEGFEGNINQHVCVIKTGNKEVSETLAAFLNSDIGERLASRRSTGGTRPALDYTALLSIPVIEDKRILKITNKVIEQKQKNETEANQLLASIDGYLLKELGIRLPPPPANTLKSRMFTVTLGNVSGSRIDPRYYQRYFLDFYKNLSAKYAVRKIKEIVNYIGSGSTPRAGGDDYTDEINGVPFIRVTNLKNDTIEFDDALFIKRDIHENILKRTQLKKDDVLISIAGTIGLSIVVPDNIIEANINQAIAKVEVKQSIILPIYLKEIINSKVGKTQTERISRPAVQANLNLDELGSLLIPLPSIEKQKEIAKYITGIRQQAQQLKDKTKDALTKASKEIEEILLK